MAKEKICPNGFHSNGSTDCSCGEKTTTNPTDWERDAIALILTPLIQQIFHGENSTSEQIHSEMDKALDRFVALLKTSKEAGVREGREEARKEYKDGLVLIENTFPPQEHRVDTQGV